MEVFHFIPTNSFIPMRYVLLALLFTTFSANAQKLPAPSPPGHAEQLVGLTMVKVDYSRPAMRGRTIFGDLVPYGKVWRTGANKCTTIELDGNVMVEGQLLRAGTYSIFTIPGEDSWNVIFNKNTELWGEGDRKEEEDVLTVKVKPQAADLTESFTIGFDAVKDDKAILQMTWEKTQINVQLHADATEQALANIKEALAEPDADFRAYHTSARFCVDRNIMAREAMGWATKSVEMEKRYWNTHTLALAQAQNNLYKEAVNTAKMSLQLAEEAKSDAYVKMNNEKIAEWSKMTPAPAKKR